MKKITKILSVILCVLTVLSSVSIMSFAAEKGTLSDTVVSETAETEMPQEKTGHAEDSRTLSKHTESEEDEISDDEKDKNSRAENLRNYYKNSYKNKLDSVVDIGEELFETAKMTFAGGAVLSAVVPPFLFVLPITLAVGAAASLVPAAAGAFVIALSPLIALFKFIV